MKEQCKRRFVVSSALVVVLCATVAPAMTGTASLQLTITGGAISAPVGTTSTPLTINVVNIDSQPVTVGASMIDGADAPAFRGESNSCYMQTLQPGQSCSISLVFSPVRAGGHSAMMHVGDLSQTGNPFPPIWDVNYSNPTAQILITANATGTPPTYAPVAYTLTADLTSLLPSHQSAVREINARTWYFDGIESVGWFNNHGQSMGWAEYSPGYMYDLFQRIFILSEGSYTELTPLDPNATAYISDYGYPIPATTWAPVINDAGEVAFITSDGQGGDGTPNGGGHVFTLLYSPITGTKLLRNPDGTPILDLGDPAFIYDTGEILLGCCSRSLYSAGTIQTLHAPAEVEALGAVNTYDAATRRPATTHPFSKAPNPLFFGGNVFRGSVAGPGVTSSGFMKAGVIVRLPNPDFMGETNAAGAVIGYLCCAANSPGYPNTNEPFLWTRTGGMQSLASLVPANAIGVGVSLNDLGQILLQYYDDIGHHLLLFSPVAPTPFGANIAVESGSTSLTFSNVTSPGTTTVTQIDAGAVAIIPGGFAISDVMAFQMSTTATFTGPVTVAFIVPGSISQAEFDQLAILHNVSGNLVDITTGRDFSLSTIYGTTTSFSPFYVASKAVRVSSLFDQTKAHKAGSTVPVKVQMVNAAGVNISSAGLQLTIRKLQRISDNTSAALVDSGNANPDSAFRYDAGLGGSGGYIYNLSTKGLAAGTYSVSFYLGSDRRFVYNVGFGVK